MGGIKNACLMGFSGVMGGRSKNIKPLLERIYGHPLLIGPKNRDTGWQSVGRVKSFRNGLCPLLWVAVLPPAFILQPFSEGLFSPGFWKIFKKNGSLPMRKKSIRMSEETEALVEKIAQQENRTQTAVIEQAVKIYADYLYMKDQATIIPDELLKVVNSMASLLERRLNNRSNQLLSALAIEVCVLEQVIAASLDVSPGEVEEYRRGAAEFLKMNQRVFRLEEGL